MDNITTVDGLSAAVVAMAKSCPIFWRAACGRRYLVPNYRCQDYFNQEYLNQLFSFYYLAYMGGDFGPRPDPVIRAVYMNQTMAMQEGRPTYFLEKELGEVLMRTPLPLDMTPPEMHWIRRQFRVMLPRDLLSIERNGVRQSVMFLDIGYAKAQEQILLPDRMEEEVKIFARLNKWVRGDPIPEGDVRPVFTRSGICVSAQITQEEVDVPGMHYGIVRPFEDLKLGELLQVGSAFETTAPCDKSDDVLLEQMQHLAIQILLFLGAVPLEYDTKELAEIRKIQVVNDRIIPSLYPAKFIGKCRYRAHYEPRTVYNSTGRTLKAHWARGVWKRQPYGPKSALRKLIWVEPYATGELRLDTQRVR